MATLPLINFLHINTADHWGSFKERYRKEEAKFHSLYGWNPCCLGTFRSDSLLISSSDNINKQGDMYVNRHFQTVTYSAVIYMFWIYCWLFHFLFNCSSHYCLLHATSMKCFLLPPPNFNWRHNELKVCATSPSVLPSTVQEAWLVWITSVWCVFNKFLHSNYCCIM